MVFEKFQLILVHRNTLPFLDLNIWVFFTLLGGGQKFEELSLIRIEAVEAIMHLNGISGAYCILPAPNFPTKILKYLPPLICMCTLLSIVQSNLDK